MPSTSTVPVLVKPTVVVTVTPPPPRLLSPRKSKVPLFVARVSSAELTAPAPIAALASEPSSSNHAPWPIEVIAPEVKSSSAIAAELG